MISSLHALLEARARSYPERPAILGLDRPPLTYAGLYEHVIRTAAALRRSGVGRNHRVALVMPNGPEMATAFLSAAVVGTCAPLNPAYRAGEFDFYLFDLDAKALLVEAGSTSPAVGAARSRGIPVIEIQPVESAPTGVFAAENDTALVLHTSGTTSRPKIVPLTHANLCTSARNVAASLALTEEDRCLNVMPLFHIHGLVASLLASLWAGASVVCTPGFDAPRFFDWMATAEPTWYTAVPTMHQSILAQAARTRLPELRRPLRLIRSSSAALPPQVMTRLEDVFRAPVIEAYGMTEAGHQIASNPLPPGRRKAGTVGLAAGPEVAIIDGEVVLRGPNVTRGYESNPEANVAAFVDGWFRTGDLGTIDDEGYLTLTGRLKEIINRGGEKISPREVEEAIMDHPAVEQVVVFAAPDHSLGESVAAAIVLRDGLTPTATEIRKFAVARLTDFKVPATILFVEEIPKGPTGKLQRIGLAETLGLGSGAGTAPAKPHIEPQSALEKLIASIWAEVLRVEQVGLEDDFLALGGDSMLATQVISRIRDKLELEITVASFFDASTVKDQAGIVEELLPAARIRRRGGSGPAELSTAQKRIWLLHQFDPASPISNRPMALRLTRTLDRDALAQALNEIARRHEILRTVFPAVEGEARQVVLPAAAIPFETQDIRETAGETREKAAQRIASAEAIRPFDLANGPLARVKLLQLGSADHVLLILMHHIVFDGWSENVFVNELKQLYRAFALHQASPLPAPPIQYADFAAWQQRRLMDGAIDGQVEYWRKQLAGAPSALNLPSDFNAPAHPRWRGEARTLLLNSSVTEGLKRASREERVSLFMTLLATLQLLLARYADQEDIVIGVPVAGRNRVETEDLIGCFMNVLVLRTRVDAGLTVRQLLGRVRDAALGAFANQEVPFEKLVEEVRPERLPDRWPLFQTMFQLRNLPKRDSVEVEGLRFEPFEFDAGVIGGLDLSVEIREAPQGLRCSFRYDASLYGGETIERMMGHFENLLDGIVRARDQRVSKLPLLGDAERRRVLVDWNDTRVAFPQDTCIHHLFEAQAERAPEAIAVESEQGRLTYRDLNRRANQVARHLRGLGARPETIVAISMERSPELLAGLLGILKSGAAYLPLDPAHPKERLAYLVRDAGATMLLTQTSLLDRLPEVDRFVCLDADSGALSRESGQNPPRIESAENLAYVIYTSGTTAEPKGVMIQHRSVVNQLLWRQQYFPLTENDRLLQRASIGFDDSVWELFEPLASGSTLVLARSRQDSDTHYLIDLIVRHQITAACFIPSLLDMLLEEPRFGECQSLRRVTTGAEVLPVDAPDRFFARVGASLINGYGPTEATIGCSYYRCETGTRLRSIPIGRPIANAEIYILDRDLEPSPIGVPGELFIGGAGLARGYLGQPDLTADKFIPHPFSAAGGARLYRTGDLARYLPDGNIEFLGRIDQQVKIRGYRIEPGEVEAVLAQHPSVRQAAVTVWEPRPGDKALAAYVVAREGSVITPSEARAFAHRRLPAYMIPSDWAVLDALPLQPNGKVNRVALPRPVRAAQLAAAPAEAPRNRLQAQLRRIWEDVLQIGDIGVRQNFFDLGGHSLLALKAFNLIERQLGLRLPLAALLAAPTIEMLAEAIEQKGYESSWASLVPIQPNGSRLPLYCVHGNDGDVLFYRDLALRLGEHQPLYGLQSPGLKDAAAMPATVEELAVLYVEEIRGVQPRGPYCLAGFCMGAYLALEMARQLQAQGERVALLAVVNTDGLWKLVRSFGGGLRFHWRNLSATEASRLGYLRGRMRSRLRSTADLVVNLTLAARIRAGRQIPQKLLARYVRARHVHASRQYWPAAPYRGDLLFLRGSDEGPGEYGAFWRRAVEGEIIGQMVPGKSIGVLREPNVLALAGKLGAALDAVQPAHDQRQVWDTIGVSRVRELEQQIQRVEQQLRLFQTISRFMVQEMSLQQVLQGIVSLVVEFMECDSCLLYLLDGDDLVLCATNAPHGRAVGSVRLNVNEGLTGWVARERTLLAISREAYRDPRFKRFQGLPEDDYESFLSAPVIARNRVVGVINVQHRESHAHTGREMEMLTTVGEQVGCLLVLARMDPGEIGEANHAGNVLASLTTVS